MSLNRGPTWVTWTIKTLCVSLCLSLSVSLSLSLSLCLSLLSFSYNFCIQLFIHSPISWDKDAGCSVIASVTTANKILPRSVHTRVFQFKQIHLQSSVSLLHYTVSNMNRKYWSLIG
eukprot:sb/3476490/